MFRNMMPFDPGLVSAMPAGLGHLRVKILRPVLLWSLARADLVIFVSEFGKAVVSRLVAVQNSCVIRHGTSDDFRTAGQTLPWPGAVKNKANYLLYVSTFLPYKNHKAVIAAYARLPESTRRKYAMVFVGRAAGVEGDEVRAFIKRAGLDRQVIMLDEVPHASLPALYRNADLIVFASSCENCPNVLIEALGAGRPVLCSNAMPMPEIGGDAPRYFPASDPEALAQAMNDVLSDPGYATDLARAAAKRSELFDAGTSARDTWKRILALAP